MCVPPFTFATFLSILTMSSHEPLTLLNIALELRQQILARILVNDELFLEDIVLCVYN